MSRYREQILALTDKYYADLNAEDFSHNFDHVVRVERLARRIGESEGADLQTIEAACLLFDVARGLEDKGIVQDHAEAGAEIAREILTKIGFPSSKLENVCHCIYVHRKSQKRQTETIEAKILQDADYLDALGAIDVVRVLASCLQSNQYKKPIYVSRPYEGEQDQNISAIHYFQYKLHHHKLRPENFNTAMGRSLARDRREFTEQFVERFVAEWDGQI
jgi:uncharacterized protein